MAYLYLTQESTEETKTSTIKTFLSWKIEKDT
jgi:hypothetical protein